mgnify:CR=1 FL=1
MGNDETPSVLESLRYWLDRFQEIGVFPRVEGPFPVERSDRTDYAILYIVGEGIEVGKTVLYMNGIRGSQYTDTRLKVHTSHHGVDSFSLGGRLVSLNTRIFAKTYSPIIFTAKNK